MSTDEERARARAVLTDIHNLAVLDDPRDYGLPMFSAHIYPKMESVVLAALAAVREECARRVSEAIAGHPTDIFPQPEQAAAFVVQAIRTGPSRPSEGEG